MVDFIISSIIVPVFVWVCGVLVCGVSVYGVLVCFRVQCLCVENQSYIFHSLSLVSCSSSVFLIFGSDDRVVVAGFKLHDIA